MKKRYLHSKVPGHELDDGTKTLLRGTDTNARESVLRDGSINDSVTSVFSHKILSDLVSDTILANFLTYLIGVKFTTKYP